MHTIVKKKIKVIVKGVITMKIGVTERGDPSIDYAWVEKMDTVDGAVIISKNLTTKLMTNLLTVKNKVIFHLSCTGYGGTVVEPNIPGPKEQLKKAEVLIAAGFPQSHIVIRVDPIIPSAKGLKRAENVIDLFAKAGFTRFRVSLMDAYPHVRKRFEDAGLPLPYGTKFEPSEKQFEAANHMLAEIKALHPAIAIESCAEGRLTEAKAMGCISKKDLEILGLSPEDADEKGYQRSGCLCCSAKTELLKEKHQCPYKCLYCYWHNS